MRQLETHDRDGTAGGEDTAGEGGEHEREQRRTRRAYRVARVHGPEASRSEMGRLSKPSLARLLFHIRKVLWFISSAAKHFPAARLSSPREPCGYVQWGTSRRSPRTRKSHRPCWGFVATGVVAHRGFQIPRSQQGPDTNRTLKPCSPADRDLRPFPNQPSPN